MIIIFITFKKKLTKSRLLKAEKQSGNWSTYIIRLLVLFRYLDTNFQYLFFESVLLDKSCSKTFANVNML